MTSINEILQWKVKQIVLLKREERVTSITNHLYMSPFFIVETKQIIKSLMHNHIEVLQYERVGYYNHKLSLATRCTFQFESCRSFKIIVAHKMILPTGKKFRKSKWQMRHTNLFMPGSRWNTCGAVIRRRRNGKLGHISFPTTVCRSVFFRICIKCFMHRHMQSWW